MAAVVGDLEEIVHTHGISRAGVYALGAMDAAVVMNDHPEFLFRLVHRGDFDGFGRTVTLTRLADDTGFGMKKRGAAEVFRDLELLKGVIDRRRLLEEMTEEFGKKYRDFHESNPFRRMTMRSWRTASGAKYFHAKATT